MSIAFRAIVVCIVWVGGSSVAAWAQTVDRPTDRIVSALSRSISSDEKLAEATPPSLPPGEPTGRPMVTTTSPRRLSLVDAEGKVAYLVFSVESTPQIAQAALEQRREFTSVGPSKRGVIGDKSYLWQGNASCSLRFTEAELFATIDAPEEKICLSVAQRLIDAFKVAAH